MTSNATLVVSDNQIQVFAPDLLETSCGYAWLRGAEVLFDVNSEITPVSVSRLHPDQINSRYWHYCDQSAVAPNEAGMRSCADLVWRHLRELKNKHSLQDVTLVVPSHYQAHQLELLLGVAQAAGLTPLAIVNKAVLAGAHAGLTSGQTMAHLDVQLHQCVLSYLRADADGVRLASYETISGCSISALQESILAALQASFIEQDRFDPFHNAATEQQLFNQLQQATAAIEAKGVATFTAELNGNLYTTSMDEAGLKIACKSRFSALGEQINKHLIVDFNGAFSPTLMLRVVDSLSRAKVVSVDMASIVPALANLQANAMAREDASTSAASEVQLIQSFAHQHKASATQSTDKAATKTASEPASLETVDTDTQAQSAATHVQVNGVAVTIDRACISFTGERITLGNAAPNLAQVLASKQLTSATGKTRSLPLQAGERLVCDLADGVVTAIRVLE